MKKLFLLFTVSFLLLNCQSRKSSENKISDFKIDNIPYELLLSSEKDSMEVFTNTSFDHESVYIFRGLFNFGPVACIQIKQNVDSLIYYQYDLSKRFFDNEKDKMVYAFDDETPSVEIKKYQYYSDKTILPELSNLEIYSRKKEIKMLKTVPENSFDFRYFIFLPKKNIFFQVNKFSENKNVLKWLESICSSLSYKEELYYRFMINRKETTDSFFKEYQINSVFYKSIGNSYLVNGNEVKLVLPKSIYEVSNER